jgi:hypothetical protein
MAYGYIIDWKLARERGTALFNPEEAHDGFKLTYIKMKNVECCRYWRRSRMLPVKYKGMVQSCIAFAENTTPKAMQLPPQGVIDEMKKVLEIDEQPKWYRYYS